MPYTPHPSSYYAALTNPVPSYPELQGRVETDVCAIGVGYTGLSTALFLLENGLKVTVLEAVKIDFGASERNGGQIVNSCSRGIDVIECTVGKREAQLLDGMAFKGRRVIRERVVRYGIQCDLEDDGVFAALTEKQVDHLCAQKQLWEHYGHNQLEIVDAKRTHEVVTTGNCTGGMLDMSGDHIQPLNLALGEVAVVESLGGRICEQSPMTRIERGVGPVVHTPQDKVEAKFTVIVGNAYLNGLAPELAVKSMPCGTQVITIGPPNEELARNLLPQGYYAEDCNYLLDYYHPSDDKRLIYGGDVIYDTRNSADIETIIRLKMFKTFP